MRNFNPLTAAINAPIKIGTVINVPISTHRTYETYPYEVVDITGQGGARRIILNSMITTCIGGKELRITEKLLRRKMFLDTRWGIRLS
jgi:hypothetical protein